MKKLADSIRRYPLLRSGARLAWKLSRDWPRHVPLQKISWLQQWSGRPTGFHRFASDYLNSYPQYGWQKVVRPGGSYERSRPFDTGIKLPARFNPPQTVSWGNERVVYLENCRYWGGYGGSIITHDERLLGELSPDVWGIERHALFNKLKLPSLKKLPGLTAIVSTPEANTNYGHWMMDLMPRLELLRLAGYNAENINRFLINLSGLPHERECLLRAGIPWSKVVPVDAGSHFQCSQIVTTNLRGNHFQYSLPQWVPSYLRRLFLSDTRPKIDGRRIFITRMGCSFRRIVNEGSLQPLLRQFGFEIVKTEKMSVVDQAELFSEAGVVIAPTGAALTNLIFCAPGTRILEIFSEDFFDVSSWSEATVAQCDYYAFVGDRGRLDSPAKTVIEARRQNLAVCPDKFAMMLCKILEKN